MDISYLQIMEQQLSRDKIQGVGYMLRTVIMAVTTFFILACYLMANHYSSRWLTLLMKHSTPSDKKECKMI
jgi:hypothetical protein